MKENKIIIASAIFGVSVLVLAFAYFFKPLQAVFASVPVTDGYIATTTSANFVAPTIWNLTATSSTDRSTHPAILGSCTVTAAGSAGGNINFYDATTTSVLKRATTLATSSILLASFPTNLAAGTYTIDGVAKYGIIAVTDGTVGTTTCTYRLGG